MVNKGYIKAEVLRLGVRKDGSKSYIGVPSPEDIATFAQQCYADGLRVAINLAEAKVKAAEAFEDHKRKQHDLNGEMVAHGAFREARHIAEELKGILEKFEAGK